MSDRTMLVAVRPTVWAFVGSGGGDPTTTMSGLTVAALLPQRRLREAPGAAEMNMTRW
jgi:hypothetical protein